MITLIQGMSFFVSLFLLLFLNVRRNLANIILYIGFCTFLTPIIGVPLYFWFINQRG